MPFSLKITQHKYGSIKLRKISYVGAGLSLIVPGTFQAARTAHRIGHLCSCHSGPGLVSRRGTETPGCALVLESHLISVFITSEFFPLQHA